MIDNISTYKSRGYLSPEIKVLNVSIRCVLCQSPGNESLGERDISDFFNED